MSVCEDLLVSACSMLGEYVIDWIVVRNLRLLARPRAFTFLISESVLEHSSGYLK